MILGPLCGPSRASHAPTWGAVLLFDGEELGDQSQGLLALGFIQFVEGALARELVQPEVVVERLAQPLLIEAALVPESLEFLVGGLFDFHQGFVIHLRKSGHDRHHLRSSVFLARIDARRVVLANPLTLIERLVQGECRLRKLVLYTQISDGVEQAIDHLIAEVIGQRAGEKIHSEPR